MKNPFKQLKKLGPALKIGYTVLQKYEALADVGIVPQFSIKGVPIGAIDKASHAFVATLDRAHQEARK